MPTCAAIYKSFTNHCIIITAKQPQFYCAKNPVICIMLAFHGSQIYLLQRLGSHTQTYRCFELHLNFNIHSILLKKNLEYMFMIIIF